MGISAKNFALLRYIQEKHSVDLAKVANHFQKTETTIRREIEIINLYTKEPIIQINKNICKTNLSYKDFVTFIQNIRLDDYSSSSEERIRVLVVIIFFEGFVNASTLYQTWGLSLTTKKQDTARLRTLLSAYGLSLETVKKKGLTVHGDEFQFMLLISQIIYQYVELTPTDRLEARIANTVLENQIFQIAYDHLSPHFEQGRALMLQFLSNYNLSITYTSRKFFLLFLYNMQQKNIREEKKYPMECVATNFYLCDNPHHNYIYNLVVNMLDFSPHLDFPHDEMLYQMVDDFVAHLEQCITFRIFARKEMVDEFYYYLFKQITANHFQCKIHDKAVRNTQDVYPILYEIIQKFSHFFVPQYHLVLRDEQITTLTLLMQKHRIFNRIINEHSKRVVIVTSIPYERISFFVTQMKEYVDFQLVDVIDINAIHRIKDIPYDRILCFSERIYDILKKKQLPVLLVHFFLENEDIDKLLLFGFHKARKRFLTSTFVDEIKGMTEHEMARYLKENYGDYFI